MNTLLSVVIIILLILINGYFSLAEIALVSVKKFKLKQEADSGNPRAVKALEVIQDPQEFLSSIQVGITLVAMIEGLYGGEVFSVYIEQLMHYVGWNSTHIHSFALVISISIITYVTIVIGELLPKSIALQYPQKIAISIVPSLNFFTKLFYPFVKLLMVSTRFIVSMLGIRNPGKEKLTEADLKMMLSLAYSQGTLDKNELELHENVFQFNDITADEIMTPVEEVVAIDGNLAKEKITPILMDKAFTTFPVYFEPGKIEGFIYAQDYFMYPDKPIKDILKSPCFILTTQTAAEIFKRFKETRENFGIVIDEAGSFKGVVTMRNIGESVFGDIPYRKNRKPVKG